MARAALNWTVRDLAMATGLRRDTITNVDVGRYAGKEGSIALIESVVPKRMRRVFATEGVRFHEAPDTGHEGH
jgi:DNA-binding XRE family transcriptional regulator